MRCADVLAVPSRTEGLPDVINEAHAIGIPVVATRCSAGVEEALEEGAAGVLVQPEDAAMLADALIRTLEDGALAARVIQAGRLRVASLERSSCIDRFAQSISESLSRATALEETPARGHGGPAAS
jgi:glycosyltransferase involved in cell wall biosynthesis